jgi:hypothetical protein
MEIEPVEEQRWRAQHRGRYLHEQMLIVLSVGVLLIGAMALAGWLLHVANW